MVSTETARRTASDQNPARVDRYSTGRESHARNVVGTYDRADRQACQVGRDDRRRMRVDDALHLRPGAQDRGVQREFVRYGPAAQLPGGGGCSVEVDQADVVRLGVQQAAFAWPATAYEQCVRVDAEADVAEDAVGESAGCQYAAGVGDQLT
jgi:hypothetical protein